MKAKVIFTLLVAVTILFSVPFIGSSAYAEDPPPKKMTREEKVILHGRLAQSTIRSAFTPFIVMQSSDLLSVYYLQNLTDIDIEILDESGQIVYSDVVDPISGDSFCIDISDWPEGYYILSFRDSLGNTVSGGFEI